MSVPAKREFPHCMQKILLFIHANLFNPQSWSSCCLLEIARWQRPVDSRLLSLGVALSIGGKEREKSLSYDDETHSLRHPREGLRNLRNIPADFKASITVYCAPFKPYVLGSTHKGEIVNELTGKQEAKTEKKRNYPWRFEFLSNEEQQNDQMDVHRNLFTFYFRAFLCCCTVKLEHFAVVQRSSFPLLLSPIISHCSSLECVLLKVATYTQSLSLEDNEMSINIFGEGLSRAWKLCVRLSQGNLLNDSYALS